MALIYLAGPGVFLPNPAAYGAAKKAICAKYGFEGVFPLDAEIEGGALPAFELGCRIALVNEALIRGADLVIADLTPYRGPSADVGTAYEMGFARALGLPVLAYSNVAADFFARARADFGTAAIGRDPMGRPQAAGMALEDFGMTDNLMLHAAVAQSGFPLLAEDAPLAERYTSLVVFEKTVAMATPYFAAKEGHVD
jgi:nucleoside 2-deoxyribosyltransferase